MREKLAYAAARQDKLRALLMLEPRGHADMSGAVLTDPERSGSNYGVIFMHADGFSAMCGHGLLAIGKILGHERPSWVLDTAVGAVTVTAHGNDVSYTGVPSFVLAAGVPVTVGTRAVHVDVAYGGAFYAIVDAEATGLAVVPAKLPELRAVGAAIATAVEQQLTLVHPGDAEIGGLDGVIFTGPPEAEGADLRSVTIFGGTAADRSPCGAGTCALLAVLDAMGLVDPSRPFVNESILGTRFRARIASRAMVGELPAIVPEVTGTAFITGEHAFLLEKDDPFPKGFQL